MPATRRQFFRHLVFAPPVLLGATSGLSGIKAIAFDAFPIFDPRPVFALVDELFPERGAELSNIWRTKQFEYTWLRTLSGSYQDFWQVTGDALAFAAKTLKIELTAGNRDRLMQAYLELRCWPDVPAALLTLKDAGLRLAFLSNMTARMLEAGIRNSRLEGAFDEVLSTDRVQAYKPDPRAYRMGADAFGVKREQVVFAAFAGWDAAGAKAFGYPTFWVNRQSQPLEELGVVPDGSGRNLADLVSFCRKNMGRR
jgi:2-haloacid dehalogenase